MALQPCNAEQPGQVDRPVDPIQLAFAQAELLEQEVGEVLRTGVHYLQPHGVAIAPRNQLSAQRSRQVLDVLGIDRQVRIARQAELVAALDLHAMEQVIGVSVNHRREEYVVGTRPADLLWHPDNPGQQPRRRNDRQPGISAKGIDPFKLDDEVQTLVDQQRERVSRVKPDGRDDRRNLVAEIAAHPGLDLGCPVAPPNKAHLMFDQLRQQHLVEDRILPIDLFVNQLGNTRQRLVRL